MADPILIPLAPPPLIVAVSNGPEFASMALLAVVLAAAAVVVRRLNRTPADPDRRPGTRPHARPAAGATRARW